MPSPIAFSSPLPKPFDAAQAALGMERWRQQAAAAEPETRAWAEAFADSEPGRALIEAVCGNSPYLGHSLTRELPFVARTVRDGFDDTFAALIASLHAGHGEEKSMDRLMAGLRVAKRRAALLIALADIAGEWPLFRVTGALSELAETGVQLAANFLLRRAGEAGTLTLPDPQRPWVGSGLIVLGMGKLGGRELNYSSDIDLIVLYDDAVVQTPQPDNLARTFIRLARDLVRIMDERTKDGYVFRTDLRLRPDPGSTPLAIPVLAALTYYEGRGQNWERAAMIKARPVAGDLAAGAAFLKELQPYVWRKYMDYAAIADVHSIKRQIHAHKGHGEIAVRGHNVKLGRGGIREIEFFVQTQQLIAGGRFPELRGRETVPMLAELAARGWITAEARDALAGQYWFLRRVEHAVQMVADEQTHTLPEDDEGLERIARMLGFADSEGFSAAFRDALQQVERHYAALFEAAPELSSGIGNLVFTGDVDDPDTLQTLGRLGFQRPSDICHVIRTWHFGRYRATRSKEARERLTELTPALLEAFGQTRRADDALIEAEGLTKGSMRLIDAEEAGRLYAAMGPAIEMSGGSAANTLAGMAALGRRCAFIGQVADDQLGSVFTHDLRALGVAYETPALKEGAPTARCLILVTPDGQRTMNTFLGASHLLEQAMIAEDWIADADILYLEGYLWDPPLSRAAMRRAIDVARGAGRKVAFTLSDAFIIDRHGDDFRALIGEGLFDILFANEVEI